jgi:DNA-binding MarR family transcriptional regulator
MGGNAKSSTEAAVASDDTPRDNSDVSISGRSAALFVSNDESIARLLEQHGIKVRDFILMSFLADQGALSVERLARVVCIEPHDVLNSVKRLATAGLVVREFATNGSGRMSIVRLTGRGQDVANSVEREL